MTPWPTHPNGKRMTLGEMPRDIHDTIVGEVMKNVQAHFEDPQVKAAIEKVFREQDEEDKLNKQPSCQCCYTNR